MSTFSNDIIEKTAQALRKNNMNAYILNSRSEVLDLVTTLLSDCTVVGLGGSVTLSECGILEYLRNADLNFLDRGKPGLTSEDIRKIYIDSFSADAYFTSSNAITQDGSLINVDGNSNRVAAMSFGPKKIIVIAGVNKIVQNVEAGFERIRNHAAPLNSKRLNCATPCKTTGKCENCFSAQRICCTYVVHRYQRQKGRINVILVNENLGY